MVETVPASHLYFDRYVTSINFMDELLSKCLPATGTITKKLLCQLPGDKQLKKEESRASVMIVRRNPELAVAKRYDSKPVPMASTPHGKDPEDVFHTELRRPAVIRKYHGWLGYTFIAWQEEPRNRPCVIAHFFNVSVTNS